jgi:Abortive infection alpha
MSEENKTRDVVDAITGAAKAVPVYQDLLQPATQEIGKALQTVAKTVHLVLAPVSALVWGYDQIKDFVLTKVSDRLKDVPPEDFVTPKLNVAGPALEALRYVGHESSLSDLYANLLAASMDKQTAHGAHPAFVEIIRQLTPDEAKLVQLFVGRRALPLIDIYWIYKPNSDDNVGGETVLVNYSHLGNIAGCELPNMTQTYIDNLCRLGLVEVPALGGYTTKGVYDELESDPKVTAIIADIEKDEKVKATVKHKHLRVSEFGKQFAQICVVRKGSTITVS